MKSKTDSEGFASTKWHHGSLAVNLRALLSRAMYATRQRIAIRRQEKFGSAEDALKARKIAAVAAQLPKGIGAGWADDERSGQDRHYGGAELRRASDGAPVTINGMEGNVTHARCQSYGLV